MTENIRIIKTIQDFPMLLNSISAVLIMMTSNLGLTILIMPGPKPSVLNTIIIKTSLGNMIGALLSLIEILAKKQVGMEKSIRVFQNLGITNIQFIVGVIPQIRQEELCGGRMERFRSIRNTSFIMI